MPQAAAGMRIDPPVSVPIVASAMPAATLAADPPLDPPGDRDGIVRIARRTERRVFVRRAERELVKIGLADEHRAGLRADAAIAGASRSATWPSRTRDAAVVGSAADVEQILDRDRHAVQRAAIVPGGELAIGLARLPPRLVRHHEDERVQPALSASIRCEALFGDLLRA